jgi:putative ABC transport system permease protein
VLQHYLLTLYRALTRRRLYAVLNIMGLAVGVAVFLVLFLDVRYETSFDRWVPQADNTYRLDETLMRPGLAPRPSAKTTSVSAPLLKADYPQITGYTRLIWMDETLTRGLTTDQEDVRYVDPDFFQVLALPLAKGDVATALSQPDNVVITETLARKYFGTTNVVGQSLDLTEGRTVAHVRVSAVLRDLPPNTHLKLGVLKVITPAFENRNDAFTDWNSQLGSTYLRFRNRADAQAVAADLANFIARRAKGSEDTKLGQHPNDMLQLRLTPLPAIHFQAAITTADFQPNVDKRIIDSLAVVAVLTLAIAILNYVNLATAQSALRAKEVAVRKALGATQRALMIQFLAEALITAFVSVLVGLAITELTLPLVNAAGGSNLALTYWGADGILPVLLIATLAIGLAAGFYPALLLSSYQPARVLASSKLPGGGKLGGQIRNGLVVFQFAAAITLTICTLVLSAQAKFVQNADRGFRHEGLIMIDSLGLRDLNDKQPLVLDALRQVPGVTAVSSTDREPVSKTFNFAKVSIPGRPGPDLNVSMELTTAGYFKTLGGELVAGRDFDRAHRSDDASPALGTETTNTLPFDVILNETAVKTLGFGSPQSALGRSFSVFGHVVTVVGAARNIRFMSPHDPVPPLIYLYFDDRVFDGIAAVRYDGADAQTMMARLTGAWRHIAPGEPFVARTADDRLSAYYLPDQQRGRMFTIGAVLAVLIGCIGLYGLASFNTARRVREIGIRKTLGASTRDILQLLISQFLRPVVIANLIAWPLAWLAMSNWLASFDQRIGLSPLYFISATALTLLIALATVGGQAFAVARAEPAQALRHE